MLGWDKTSIGEEIRDITAPFTVMENVWTYLNAFARDCTVPRK
jgi:hypothetical protein